MTADRRSPGFVEAPLTQPASLSIDDLDVIAPGAFAAAVAPLFEGARRFLGRLAMARPFGTLGGDVRHRPVDRAGDAAR